MSRHRPRGPTSRMTGDKSLAQQAAASCLRQPQPDGSLSAADSDQPPLRSGTAAHMASDSELQALQAIAHDEVNPDPPACEDCGKRSMRVKMRQVGSPCGACQKCYDGQGTCQKAKCLAGAWVCNDDDCGAIQDQEIARFDDTAENRQIFETWADSR